MDQSTAMHETQRTSHCGKVAAGGTRRDNEPAHPRRHEQHTGTRPRTCMHRTPDTTTTHPAAKSGIGRR